MKLFCYLPEIVNLAVVRERAAVVNWLRLTACDFEQDITERDIADGKSAGTRSEERRVGKECRL